VKEESIKLLDRIPKLFIGRYDSYIVVVSYSRIFCMVQIFPDFGGMQVNANINTARISVGEPLNLL